MTDYIKFRSDVVQVVAGHEVIGTLEAMDAEPSGRPIAWCFRPESGCIYSQCELETILGKMRELNGEKQPEGGE